MEDLQVENLELDRKNLTLNEKNRALGEENLELNEKSALLAEENLRLNEKTALLAEDNRTLGEENLRLNEKTALLAEGNRRLGEENRILNQRCAQIAGDLRVSFTLFVPNDDAGEVSSKQASDRTTLHNNGVSDRMSETCVEGSENRPQVQLTFPERNGRKAEIAFSFILDSDDCHEVYNGFEIRLKDRKPQNVKGAASVLEDLQGAELTVYCPGLKVDVVNLSVENTDAEFQLKDGVLSRKGDD